jgi:Holliday junction resolvase RusA-like endonuclease
VPNLPVPLTLNNAYRNMKDKGGRALTTAAKKYKAEVAEIVAMEALAAGFTVPPNARLHVEFVFVFPTNARDGDNAVKLPLDAAATALGFNDNQVVSMYWQKLVNAAAPRCDMTIRLCPR